MKHKKYIGVLSYGFALFIILMVLMTSVGSFFRIQIKMHFEDAALAYTKWIVAEQANADFIALHRAMKDVALSRNEAQLAVALEDVQRYEASIENRFNALKELRVDSKMLYEAIGAYNDWMPVREKTIELVRGGQYDEAADNTGTLGGEKVDLITGRMASLISYEQEAAQAAHTNAQEASKNSSILLFWIIVSEVLISSAIAVYMTRKVTDYEFRLHEEKEELRIAFDSIGDGVITTDNNKRILKINKAAEELTGWKTEEACGRQFDEVFRITSAVSGEKAKDPVEEVLATDRICGLENHTVLTSKDGVLRHIADSASPIKDQKGKTTGVVMVFRDVTQKRKYQQQIKKSEEHYRMLFNTMLNGYALHEMIFDENGNPADYRFVDVNPAFENMIGMKKSECVGKTVKELLPDTEQYWIDTYGKVTRTGEAVRYNNFSKELNKYFEVYAFRPVESHFSVLVKDVSETKRLERENYEERELLKITFDSIGDGVITTDTERNIQSLNRTAEELTGWKEEDARWKKISEVFEIIDETTGKPAKDMVCEVLSGDRIYEVENQMILTSKNSVRRNISSSAAPIKDQNGKTFGVVIIFRDVTEKKAYMEDIRYLSFHDFLTGLYNRAYFEKELRRLDNEKFLPLSIVMGDVNGLKLLNDVYGHEAGDQMLTTIAQVLRKICAKEHVIARLGGDEFAIILPNTGRDEVDLLYERIKTECNELDLKPVVLSISLGAATKTDVKTNINDVVKEAEDRMYTHKLLEGKSFRNTVISSLQKTLFEKNSATQEHAVRMIQIANKFCVAINLSQYEIDQIKLLALLHDVGKIAISDQILNKREELSMDEWNEMKKHPEIGFRIAQSTAELAHISDLILTHHEKWDGSGYPQGLKGEEIPKLSRILSIIDAYDAITNGRPYKKPAEKADALEEIRKNAGTQFDPELVDAFLKVMQ